MGIERRFLMLLCDVSFFSVSIGRRVQDPLAELVKIDPKHIGIGTYQVSHWHIMK